MHSVSIVIPAYNEERRLPASLDAILRYVESKRFEFTEILVVDDGSTDGSMEAIRELSERDPRVRGVQFRRNYGKSAALAAGLARATGT